MNRSLDRSFLKPFGDNLKRLRLAKGLSYRKMAQNCLIDHADIKKYELGETNLSLLTILELAKGLNIEAKELLNF
ncbi:helix-turn-helix domain-containing protein [Mucilaginibacter lutimaris]|uniref:Helix-turn-helix domain-containing protein n=1 Tax=Mucilaginibacter lutimaris TaxID=931629 RepID=A0ABW2ZH28_9SPHI